MGDIQSNRRQMQVKGKYSQILTSAVNKPLIDSTRFLSRQFKVQEKATLHIPDCSGLAEHTQCCRIELRACEQERK
ncbi:hypothetical protein J6590_014915 [Homalodisca vitripennis]|nr:hypothetical protein J6590_014915 [Homalodisca vitripennis]